MMHNRDRLSILALLIAGLLGGGIVSTAGCGSSETKTPNASDPGRCERDDDCPDGQRCRRNHCTVSEAESRQLDFRFIPSNASAFPEQSIRDVSVGADHSLDVALDSSVEVEGAIVPQESSQLGPSGTLVFRPPEGGARLDHRESVSSGNFQAFVLPGRYDLTFIPSDPTQFPSRSWRNRLFTRQTQIELSFPRLIEVEGNLLFQPSLSPDSSGRGVSRARVVAISADGAYTSTVATTDTRGHYTLRLVPDTGSYDLHVRPVSRDAAVPEVVFERAIRTDEESTRSEVSQLLGRYPDPGELISVTLELQGPERLQDGLDWSGAQIRLEASVGKGTLRKRATVDDEGRVELELLPVRYDVQVVVPARSPLASERFCLDLTDASSDECRSLPPEPLTLTPKREVRGRITDPSGTSLRRGRLTFIPVGDDTANADRRTSVSIDKQGQFATRLETGDYIVRIDPRPGTGHPRTLRRVEADQIASDDELQLQLAEPLVVVGTVLGRGKEQLVPVADTRIEVVSRRGGQRLTIGTAQTDREGSFLLSLPAEEGDGAATP